MTTQPVIAVDFDGVIHRYSKGWNDGTIYDPPMENAWKYMSKLKEKGFYLIIFSTRALDKWVHGRFQKNQVEQIERWLDFYDIPYDEISKSGKPMAHAYLDDRGVRFHDWIHAYDMLCCLFPENLNEKSIDQ